ncbi:MAG TPA: cytochrome c oxidase subunit II [Bryobacteraceae bacterium]|nr:cytochrome c oxidase subunit II [Bryobacteraceae bacterium]
MMGFPPAATEWAEKVDWLNGYLFAWIFFFTALIALGVFVFAIRYRRRSEVERPKAILGSVPLELAWTIVPFVIGLSMFAWASALYFEYGSPPANASEVFVTGRQWMFWTQHPEGNREINELHVPTGRQVRLTMTSEDVIHSFFIPAFRIKHDVLPGRYTSIWFTPTRVGKYHLFCAEYCGSQHSGMGGWVYVMEPAEFEAWLTGGGSESMASQGEKLFAQVGCSSCHVLDGPGRCPNLRNVYGSRVQLQGGQTVVADDAYIRESILNPSAKIVAGYQNIMTSYQGQLNEQNILQLIAYIRSLSSASQVTGAGRGGVGQESGTVPPRNDNLRRFRGLTPTQ